MDKKVFSPNELIKIATNHAYCAAYLLDNNAELPASRGTTADALFAITTLMYMAFELTLKAYLLHDHKKTIQPKSLMELLELNSELRIADQDRQLLRTLSRQQAFRKGTDYELWEARQELQLFCAEIMDFYERLQEVMPLELQRDYQCFA